MNNNAQRDYINSRTQSGRDDRCDQSKLHSDAVLRGKMGSHTANKIIAHIDEMKSWR